MLTIFLSPFPFRGSDAPYLWMFYKCLQESKESLHFIMSPSYLQGEQHFSEAQRWEVETASFESLGYEFPSETVLARHRFSHIQDNIFMQLLSICGDNPILAFKRLVTERIPFLEVEFKRILSDPELLGCEVILSCLNCPSLEAVAETCKVPVIHIELGPLRAPNYRGTAYFDFTGVNGNTEAERRYLDAVDEMGEEEITVEELRAFFICADYDFSPCSSGTSVGVPLQVEDDSNLVAFGSGYDNSSLIAYSNCFRKKDILVRVHPNSIFTINKGGFEIDESPNSLEFILACKEIITINSSVGLEALLFERKVTLLGDSSFAFLTQGSSCEGNVKRLAFYMFCYLIPFNFAFDPNYIRFRLQSPSALEILKWHMRAYGYIFEGKSSLIGIMKRGVVYCNMEKLKQLNSRITEDIGRLGAERQELLQRQQELLKMNEELSLSNQLLAESNQDLASERENLTRTITEQFERGRFLDEVLASSSWKVTAPLRKSRRLWYSLICALKVKTVKAGHALRVIKSEPQILLRAIRYIFNNGFTASSSRVDDLLNIKYSVETSLSGFKHQAVTHVLTTKHCVFVAELIKRNMEKAGFLTDIIFEAPLCGFDSSLHFVICPQVFTVLPGNYVAFQMEQSVSSRWFEESYIKLLENSYAILDYSLLNIKFLQEKGLSLKQIYYVPISYNSYVSESTCLSKEYDVLFYGDTNNERRQRYLAALQGKYTVKVIDNVFGESLYREIEKAKIVVNIHYYEDALLETTRIYECLSRHALVVSERSSDITEHSNLEGVVEFSKIGDIDDMVRRIDYWLSSETRREEKIAKNKQALLLAPDYFEYYFHRFLLATDSICFDKFYDIAGHNVEFYSEFVCLGLPESTERRAEFEKDNRVGFQYFPGLRHNMGWVGCGLSYKFILRKAYEQALKKITICEDDVEFCDGWKEKLDRIHQHLEDQGDSWDIVSGLIANLHAETNVRKIESIGGLELVHIDKMTSTVLNTYSSSVFDKVMRWDENYRDPYKNTIDRFIENQYGIDIVTTSPFLVGHKEELMSTLWGFQNSQYTEMIAASESLLREKVDMFKSENILN